MAVSVRDVAARAGVSVGTVSNVLNRPHLVSPETSARVMDAVQALGFVRNDAARQLRAGQSRAFGMVVLDAANPFFAELARGAEDAASERSLAILLGNSGEDERREQTYLDLFEEQRVRGILVTPVGDVSDRVRRLRERGIAVVLVDSASEDETVSSVSVDDVAGGRIAVEHLIARGSKRIAFLGGSFGIRQVEDRLSGARQAAKRAPGVTFTVIDAGGLSVVDGRQAAAQLIEADPAERPDGVFAANDLLAVGVLQGLLMSGSLRVPDDIALIGYDDIDFASSTIVPLSSVRQPAHLLGRTAAEILIAESEGTPVSARHVIFQPELVERASTRR